MCMRIVFATVFVRTIVFVRTCVPACERAWHASMLAYHACSTTAEWRGVGALCATVEDQEEETRRSEQEAQEAGSRISVPSS